MTITWKQVDIGQPILTPDNHKSITLKKKKNQTTAKEIKRRKIREELQKQLENKEQNGNKFIPTLQ